MTATRDSSRAPRSTLQANPGSLVFIVSTLAVDASVTVSLAEIDLSDAP